MEWKVQQPQLQLQLQLQHHALFQLASFHRWTMPAACLGLSLSLLEVVVVLRLAKTVD